MMIIVATLIQGIFNAAAKLRWTGYLMCHYLAHVYFIYNIEKGENILMLQTSFAGNF